VDPTAATQLTPEQAVLVRSSTVVDRALRAVGGRSILPREELKSVAHLALCSAAQRFDASKQVPFDGFAWVVVLRALGKALRAEARHHRHRVAEVARDESYGDLSDVRDPGDVWSDTDESTRGYLQDMSDQAAARMALGIASAVMATADEERVVQAAHYQKLIAALREVISALPEYERRLLELRYFEGREFDPIASELRVSNATIRRHHLAALALLGKRMRSRGFAGA
jgi:RNA polymerase sigma factor (sigma-70 family)